jgi:branched-chain amino acid transport system permease protein
LRALTSIYIYTVGVYFCSDAIFALGLNLQYGMTGTLNFGYVLSYAVGAYIGGMVELGSAHGQMSQELQQTFAWGLNLGMPYPLGVVAAAIGGALVASVIGLVLRRSLRDDFGALATVAIFLVIFTFVGAYTPLANGYNGIAGIASPVGNSQLEYLLISFGWLAASYLVAAMISSSPYGRKMRAIRERPDAAAALGKNVFRTRYVVFIVSSAIAAVAGAVLVMFISAWGPLSWEFTETLVVFSAVIVGGRGNNLGVVIGALLVVVLLNQAVLFLPSIPAHPTLMPSLQWVFTGIVTIGFLWWRPAGLIPERKTNWRRLEPSAWQARVINRIRVPKDHVGA